MKLIYALLIVLSGCAMQPEQRSLNYYPSLYGSSNAQPSPVNTYWVYGGGRVTPVIQSGNLIMPLQGFGSY